MNWSVPGSSTNEACCGILPYRTWAHISNRFDHWLRGFGETSKIINHQTTMRIMNSLYTLASQEYILTDTKSHQKSDTFLVFFFSPADHRDERGTLFASMNMGVSVFLVNMSDLVCWISLICVVDSLSMFVKKNAGNKKPKITITITNSLQSQQQEGVTLAPLALRCSARIWFKDWTWDERMAFRCIYIYI